MCEDSGKGMFQSQCIPCCTCLFSPLFDLSVGKEAGGKGEEAFSCKKLEAWGPLGR